MKGESKDKNKLTPKQMRFVDEYLVDCNGTKAAIRAGYKSKNADNLASELLGKTWVREAIDAKLQRLSIKTEITAEKVLQEYAKIGFSNMGDFVDWDADRIIIKASSELTKEQLACVAEVTETRNRGEVSVKFKLHDKLSALHKLGDHLGLFKKIVEMSGKDGQAIKIEQSELDLSGLTAEELLLFKQLSEKITKKAE